MTAAKKVSMWHRGVEKGAEALENAWRRADLRQSIVRCQRKASGLRAASKTFANSDSVTRTAQGVNKMELTEKVARFVDD